MMMNMELTEAAKMNSIVSGKTKTTIILSIKDADTENDLKSKLEFFDDSPDTMKATIVRSVTDMMRRMGYLGESK